jgi:hypothetical protein
MIYKGNSIDSVDDPNISFQFIAYKGEESYENPNRYYVGSISHDHSDDDSWQDAPQSSWDTPEEAIAEAKRLEKEAQL